MLFRVQSSAKRGTFSGFKFDRLIQWKGSCIKSRRVADILGIMILEKILGRNVRECPEQSLRFLGQQIRVYAQRRRIQTGRKNVELGKKSALYSKVQQEHASAILRERISLAG